MIFGVLVCSFGMTVTLVSYQGLSLISGIGAQVKKTVTNRKDRLPHTSDNAPIRGADMNDSRPLTRGDGVNVSNVNNRCNSV